VKTRPLLVIVAMAIGLMGVEASPAKADNPPMTAYCESGTLCVWWDSHYSGNRYPFQYSNPQWTDTGNAAIANDDSSSRNNGTSGLRVSIYTGPNYTDTRVVCLAMGSYTGHHSPTDSGDSNVWVSSC